MSDDPTRVFSAVTVHDGDYLLLHKNDYNGNLWQIPGGKPEEEDNSSLSGAFRELEEEVGFEPREIVETVQPLKPYAIRTRRNLYEVHPHVMELSERIDPVLSDEHDDYGWLPREKYRTMPDRVMKTTFEYVEAAEVIDELRGYSTEPMIHVPRGTTMNQMLEEEGLWD